MMNKINKFITTLVVGNIIMVTSASAVIASNGSSNLEGGTDVNASGKVQHYYTSDEAKEKVEKLDKDIYEKYKPKISVNNKVMELDKPIIFKEHTDRFKEMNISTLVFPRINVIDNNDLTIVPHSTKERVWSIKGKPGVYNAVINTMNYEYPIVIIIESELVNDDEENTDNEIKVTINGMDIESNANMNKEESHKIIKEIGSQLPAYVLKNDKTYLNKIKGQNKDVIISEKIDGEYIYLTVKHKDTSKEYKIREIDLKPNKEVKPAVDSHKGWSKPSVDNMYQRGILSGYMGQLRLKDNITHTETHKLMEMISLVNRVPRILNTSEDKVNSILYQHKDKWYYDTTYMVLRQYKENDLTKINLREINNPITREEVAQLIYRLYGDRFNIKLGEALMYKDINNVNDTTSIEFVTETKIMKGYNDGNFNPKGKITREEMITVLSNLEGAFKKIN